MNRFIVVIMIAFVASPLYAQYNVGTTYCEHNDLNASRYQPSEMDFGDRTFQIGLNYDFFVGNQYITYSDIRGYYRDNAVDDTEREVLVFEGQGDNLLGFGQNFQLFGFGYQHRMKDGRKMDFAVSIVDKANGNFFISDNFMTLVFKGNNNSTFRGKWVNLGKTEFNVMWTREYAVNATIPLFYKDQDHMFRLGVRPKYIQGIAAINADRSEINMFTSESGDEISLDFDYKYQTSGVTNFNPTANNGSGLGLDLGLTYFINQNFEVVATILDIGHVTYRNNLTDYYKSGDTTFTGVEAEAIIGSGGGAFQDFVNDIQRQLEPIEAPGEEFTMDLGTKISLEFQYRTPDKTKDDHRYVSNSVYLTYIQGLNNQPGNTTRPYVALGYMHDFHTWFDIGGLVSYGGFNNFAVGAFFAVNILESFKFGVNSDNITAWVFPNNGTGADVAANLSWSF